MLEHNKTIELILLAQKGDEQAKATLIESNFPLIKSIAKRFYGRLEFDDLIQLGSMGLVKAINNFDTSFEVRFSTYAVPMIMGEIKRYLRDDGTVKISRALKSLSTQISKFVEQYKAEFQKEPTVDEIAKKLGVDPHEVIFAMDANQSVISIYAESEENGSELINRLVVNEMNDDSLDKMLIKDTITTLPDREKKIIILRYFRDKTQSEVAKEMGVSQVQVSRIENKILQKLKEKIAY